MVGENLQNDGTWLMLFCFVVLFFSQSGNHPDRRYHVSSGEPSGHDDRNLHRNLQCRGTS